MPHLAAALWLVLPIVVAGCSEASIAPVKGRVLCNGKPVNAAQVTFNPIPKSEKDFEPGNPGTGFTDTDGAFVLSSYKNFDGAHIGEHNVSIMLDDTNPAPCKRNKQIKLEVKPGDNNFDLELNQ
jgi:hypothetical protein